MKRKFHFVYKTTCLITQKFYIGMHTTHEIDDGYLGSGTLIGESILNYGKENHIREILSFHDTRKLASEAERHLVNRYMIEHEDCLNLALGGTGGFCLQACRNGGRTAGKINGKKTGKSNLEKARLALATDPILIQKIQTVRSENGKLSGKKTGSKNMQLLNERLRTDPELLRRRSENAGKALRQMWQLIPADSQKRKMPTEQKLKQSNTNKERGVGIGERNGNFGSCWVKNDHLTESKIVKSEQVQHYLDSGWTKGRKIYSK